MQAFRLLSGPIANEVRYVATIAIAYIVFAAILERSPQLALSDALPVIHFPSLTDGALIAIATIFGRARGF